ncbi:MAG: hypothetical protein RDU14_16580 [Melioribacteraceae bacterium]|nr:hypothetical protein [Melioribacteraceae bacterium]
MKTDKIHFRKRYYFGYGYRCIQAIGKGAKEKMTTDLKKVTCKNCIEIIKSGK